MHNELLTHLPWDIAQVGFPYSHQFYTNKNAIIRNDTHEVLAFVGARYVPFSNQRLHELTYALEETGLFTTQGYESFKKGKLVLAFLQYTGARTAAYGFPTEETLVIANSHDGSRRFHISRTQQLIRCMNQYNAGVNLINRIHNQHMESNDQMVEVIRKAFEEDLKKDEIFCEGLIKKEVGEPEIKEVISLIKDILGEPKKKENSWADTLLKSIEHEMDSLGSNAFGLWNGVTWFTTHHIQRREKIISGRGPIGQIHEKTHSYLKILI